MIANAPAPTTAMGPPTWATNSSTLARITTNMLRDIDAASIVSGFITLDNNAKEPAIIVKPTAMTTNAPAAEIISPPPLEISVSTAITAVRANAIATITPPAAIIELGS